MAAKSVCYACPTFLLRRPISELLMHGERQRKTALLIPSRGEEHGRQLHHTELFGKASLLTYRAWQLPGPFEWPIPGLGFLRKARTALTEYDILHVWTHFYPSVLLLMLLSLIWRRKGRRIILTMDTLPGYSFSAGPVMDLLFKVYTWTFGRIVYGVPEVITLYGESLLSHARRSGIDMERVKVIPTGVHAHRFPPRREARRRLLAELGLPATGRRAEKLRIVLYAGLLNPRKRVQDVLAVARAMPEALFLVAGDGLWRKRLVKEAAGMGNVRFLGWRKDIPALLKASDALLFPSAAEGLPGIVMEAMRAQTVVVTTRIPCTTDLIREGTEGLLCAVGDTRCLERQLRKALTDRRLSAKLKKGAFERIHDEFGWHRLLGMYEALYDE